MEDFTRGFIEDIAKALSPHIPAGKEEMLNNVVDVRTGLTYCSQCKQEIKPLPEKTKEEKVITFDKSALPELCKIMGVPYDKDIIAFTKKGAVKNWLDLIEEPEKTYCECNPPRPNMYDEKRCNCGKEIKQPEKTCLNCGNLGTCEPPCSKWQPKPQEVKVIPKYTKIDIFTAIRDLMNEELNHLTQDKK